jgi:hypothetical protein
MIMVSKGISPNSLGHGQQVYLQTHLLMASTPSLDHDLSVYLQICCITAFNGTPKSLDHGLEVYL